MPKRPPLFLGDNGPEELGDSDYLAAKAGVLFGSDTAAANVLSDYEEGDWTPMLPHGGTLTIGSAKYIKIGRQVTVNCYITGITPAAVDAFFLIGGLPFNCGPAFASVVIGYNGTSTLISWTAYVEWYSTVIYMYASGVMITNNAYIAAGGNPTLILTATYFV